MESLPSLSNPPQQPVPSNEGWDTQQSKILQGLEHVLEEGRGEVEGRGREGRKEGKGEGKLNETQMKCDDSNMKGTME